MDPEELDADDSWSDFLRLFGLPHPEPKPIHVEIPNEILSLIAEHCVEPYDLESTRLFPLSTSENCLVHLASIALTSRAFAGGIRTGLCRSFTGKLTIYSPRAARRLPGIMKRHNIEWLAHGVTELIVHATGKQPLGGIDYNLYHNVAIIELSYNNHDRYDEPGYIMNISSEDDFEDLAMWRAQEAKRLILRPGREKLLMDKLEEKLLMDKLEEKLLMDKLERGLKVLVLQSYVWLGGMRWETMQNIIDISGAEPLVVKKDTYFESI